MTAVARFGPAAADRTRWLADRYPGINGDRLAAIATGQYLKRSRLRTLAVRLAGPLGVAASLAGTMVLGSRLVLELAAGYGLDPRDARRAAELLVLFGAYRDLPSAMIAVTTALRDTAGHPAAKRLWGALADQRPSTGAPAVPAQRAIQQPGPNSPGSLDSAQFTVLGAALWSGVRSTVSRMLPGSGAALAVYAELSADRRFAERAVRAYRDWGLDEMPAPPRGGVKIDPEVPDNKPYLGHGSAEN